MQIPLGIKSHYEKIICACCFLILFTNIGLPSTSFSVYQPCLVEIPGVGHAGGSIIVSIRTFISLLAMFFVAKFYRLLDCRLGVLVSSLCVGVGFALYSFFAESFVGLCVASVFYGSRLWSWWHGSFNDAYKPLVFCEYGQLLQVLQRLVRVLRLWCCLR